MFRIKITSNNYEPNLAFISQVHEAEFDTIKDAYLHAKRCAWLRCRLYGSRHTFYEIVASDESIMAAYEFVHPHSVLVVARNRKKIENGETSGTLCACFDVIDENGNICDVEPYISGGGKP